jgi:hypothetical protein
LVSKIILKYSIKQIYKATVPATTPIKYGFVKIPLKMLNFLGETILQLTSLNKCIKMKVLNYRVKRVLFLFYSISSFVIPSSSIVHINPENSICTIITAMI